MIVDFYLQTMAYDMYDCLYTKSTPEVNNFMKAFECVPTQYEATFLAKVLMKESDIKPVSIQSFVQFTVTNNVIQTIIAPMINKVEYTVPRVYSYINPFKYEECVEDYSFKRFFEKYKDEILDYYYETINDETDNKLPIKSGDPTGLLHLFISELNKKEGVYGHFNPAITFLTDDNKQKTSASFKEAVMSNPFLILVTTQMSTRLKLGYMMRIMVKYALEHKIPLTVDFSTTRDPTKLFSKEDVEYLFHNTFGENMSLRSFLVGLGHFYTKFVTYTMSFVNHDVRKVDQTIPTFVKFTDYGLYDDLFICESSKRLRYLHQTIGLNYNFPGLFLIDDTNLKTEKCQLFDVLFDGINEITPEYVENRDTEELFYRENMPKLSYLGNSLRRLIKKSNNNHVYFKINSALFQGKDIRKLEFTDACSETMLYYCCTGEEEFHFKETKESINFFQNLSNMLKSISNLSNYVVVHPKEYGTTYGPSNIRLYDTPGKLTVLYTNSKTETSDITSSFFDVTEVLIKDVYTKQELDELLENSFYSVLCVTNFDIRRIGKYFMHKTRYNITVAEHHEIKSSLCDLLAFEEVSTILSFSNNNMGYLNDSTDLLLFIVEIYVAAIVLNNESK